MTKEKSFKRDRYYTRDHEWIDFRGTVAYTGVCQFKLIGFKEIHQIRFRETSGFTKKGAVIAVIKYRDYRIEAHMPVDGKIIQLNDALQSGQANLLLQQAENSGWIALIIPSQPYERKDLLLPKQYQMSDKGKDAK
jgi:glycine cleavage system H lipoate-binding protein